MPTDNNIYETTTVTKNETTSNTTTNTEYHSFYQPQMHSKAWSRSEPNLNKNKLDTWSTWPEYTVDQDISLISNNETNLNDKKTEAVWMKKEIWPNNNYQFEIEVEKKHPSNKNAQMTTTTSVCIDGCCMNNAKVSASTDGQILIENVSLNPCNEIIIESDYVQTNNNQQANNKRPYFGRLNSKSTVSASNNNNNNTTNNNVSEEIAAATRISSGYFSGDEFRTYYNAAHSNPSYLNSIINAPLPQNNNGNNSCSSPNSAFNDIAGNQQFNIQNFLNNKNKTKTDALEEFNTMYKSLGLEEDEIIFERTNINEHPLYGKITMDSSNQHESKNFCQSSPNFQQRNNNNRYQRSRSSNYDRLDRERFIPSYNTNDLYTGLDHSEVYSSFSIFNNNNETSNDLITTTTRRSARKPTADTLKDDMAARRCKPMTPAQLEREIYINNSYLNKSPTAANLEQSFTSSNYNNPSFLFYQNINNKTSPNSNEPDILRDDASVLNMRKRSNSLSSLHSCMTNTQLETPNVNSLILPSPTSADYLRNRIRETALFNVVMNPTKNTNDVELSQILYDDMAYRQLRKDSDAFKLAQIKSAANNNVNSGLLPTTPIVNIATLPLNYSNKNPQQTDSYYQQYFSGSNQQPLFNEITDDYETNSSTYHGHSYQKRNSNNNSINESYNTTSNNSKTVKMVKQKDAKNHKHTNQAYSSFNPQYDANKYKS